MKTLVTESQIAELAALFATPVTLPTSQSALASEYTRNLLKEVRGDAKYQADLKSFSDKLLDELMLQSPSKARTVRKSLHLHRYALKALMHSLAHVAARPTRYKVVAVSLRSTDYIPGADFEHLSYTAFKRVLDLLTAPEMGSPLCRKIIGTFDRIKNSGVRTRVEPYLDLKNRLLKAGLIWSTHPHRLPPATADHLLFLKNSVTKEKAPLTRPLRQVELVLPLVNQRLAKADIRLTFPDYRSYQGEWDFRHHTFGINERNNQLHRQFVDDDWSGGRLSGHFVQSIRRELRPYLTINGEHVFEYDYQGMQVAVAYDLIDEEAPHGDPYDIPGYGPSKRDIFKACFTSAIGIDAENPKHNQMSAFSNAVKKQTGSYLPEGEAEKMDAAFWDYHAPLKPLIGAQAWRRLQHRESEIILEVLRRLEEQGIPAIPIHDAVLVPMSHEQSLRRAMVTATNDMTSSLHVQPAKWTQEAYPHLFPVRKDAA